MGVARGKLVSLAVIAPLLLAAGIPAPMPTSMPFPVDDRERAVACLTAAIAYEAGYEPLSGQQAVAEVVLNRLRHPAFPKSICGVIFAGSSRRTGCQFTFTCDGALDRRLPARVLATARMVAEGAIDGRNPVRAPGATHYHADYVSPYWATSLSRVTKIGAHIFYGASIAGARASFGTLQLGPEPTIPAVARSLGANRVEVQASAGQAEHARVFAPWGLAVAQK